MRRLVAGVPALLLVVSGLACQADTKRAVTQPVPVSLNPQPAPPGPGRFYVGAGANSLAADLYEMRFSPLAFQRLTTDARVTTISGCAKAGVIVAAAQEEVGYADRLQIFRDGKLQPIEGLGRPAASDPQVAPDCRILFYEQTGTSGALVGHLRLWDPVKGATTTLDSGDIEGLAGGTWGPGGAVAVLRREPGAAKLTIIQPDGSRRVVDPKMPDAGNMQWGETGWLALGEIPPGGDHEVGTVFINPRTGARSALPGWAPLVWSPDGAHLLVARADDRSKLGMVGAANLIAAREVATSEVGPVWDAVWLPA